MAQRAFGGWGQNIQSLGLRDSAGRLCHKIPHIPQFSFSFPEAWSHRKLAQLDVLI